MPSSRIVYRPRGDYFNCVTRRRVRVSSGDRPRSVSGGQVGLCGGDGGGESAADELRFFVRDDASGRRSADATHRVWVANANDAPKWRGATTMRVEALQLGSLPSLSLIDADGDVDEWEAQLETSHGYVSLPQAVLDRLVFSIGDGPSDQLLRVSGRPSDIIEALEGASYRALDAHNDSITLRIADPKGAAMRSVGTLRVEVSPALATSVTQTSPSSPPPPSPTSVLYALF